MDSKTTIQMIPKVKSCHLVSPMCLKVSIHVSKKPSASIFMPRRLLTWVVPMVIAAADVNPLITGRPINVIKNPVTQTITFLKFVYTLFTFFHFLRNCSQFNSWSTLILIDNVSETRQELLKSTTYNNYLSFIYIVEYNEIRTRHSKLTIPQ